MKAVMKYIVFAVLVAFLAGCGTASKEIMTKSYSDRADIFTEVKGEDVPPKGLVDLVIKVSLKTHLEGDHAFESKKSGHGKSGYPFVLNIDGQGILWKAQGQKECALSYGETGRANPEAGIGMKYSIEKKIRLRAAMHTVFFGLPAEDYSAEFNIGLSEGGQNVLEFKPVYKDRSHRKRSNSEYDVVKFEVFFNGSPFSF